MRNFTKIIPGLIISILFVDFSFAQSSEDTANRKELIRYLKNNGENPSDYLIEKFKKTALFCLEKITPSNKICSLCRV